MKKFIQTVLALTLALSMTLPVFAEPDDSTDTDTDTELTDTETDTDTDTDTDSRFSDIDTEDFAWARSYINAMAEKGLISGYEDGTFRPDNEVTRLEALSLFARAMGSNDEVNEPLLEIAHDMYDEVISDYGLSWGEDEIAYLMYKGALKKTDLDTYLKDNEKNTAMKRYEAAIIITKAMGGEDEALDELGVVLDYTDARDVPSNAIQYVAYATDAGIMEGMGDGTFSPNTEVKRSQMAVMLSRTVDKTDYSFYKVKLTDIDTTEKILTVTNDGDEETYDYTDSTTMKNMGDEVQPDVLDMSVDAIITLSGDELVSVDTLSSEPDQTISGKYVNYATTSGKTTVRITTDDGETVGYECSEDLTVTYDGSPATVRSFTKGDAITLELVNGKIANIIGGTKTTKISSAIVESMDISSDDITITISHGDDEYNGMTYTVSSDVSVKKNSVTVGLDSIYVGDKVTLTLEYGVITGIVATSTKKTVEGTIKSLTISTQSTMVVSVDGEEETYQIPSDVEILINDEEGSLYDFRVGDAVKLTLESDAITKIVATTTQESSGHITGVVTAFNSSYGVITVKPDDSSSTTQIYAKDDTTKFITAEGTTKKMSNISVGQTVDIRGTVSNGVFVAKLVVIVSD